MIHSLFIAEMKESKVTATVVLYSLKVKWVVALILSQPTLACTFFVSNTQQLLVSSNQLFLIIL